MACPFVFPSRRKLSIWIWDIMTHNDEGSKACGLEYKEFSKYYLPLLLQYNGYCLCQNHETLPKEWFAPISLVITSGLYGSSFHSPSTTNLYWYFPGSRGKVSFQMLFPSFLHHDSFNRFPVAEISYQLYVLRNGIIVAKDHSCLSLFGT